MRQKKEMSIMLPQLAESVVSATINKWLKQPGEAVAEYEALCEIITDKVTAELPSTVAGTMQTHLVQEGETIDVGTAVCVLLVDETEATEQTAQQLAPSEGDHATEVGQSLTSQHNEASDQSMRSRLSPAVRALAEEHSVDLQDVQGTGLGGRITRKDVLDYIKIPKTSPVRSTGLHLTQAQETIKQKEDNHSTHRSEYFIDVTPIRNTIATRMRQSVSEIPHAWTMIEVDATNMVTVRNKLKEEFVRKEGFNLTYLAFLIKAVVNAIKEYPIMNSVWAVDKIIVKKDINISLAVGTEDAVFMPVIKHADQKNIAGLAREIDELTKKARSGKLALQDMQDGTFTINNTGAFGSILSQPIINYPQACNFSFESIVKKPVVINDMIAVRSMVNLCLSLDHRILDGVICGRFLQRVKENIESYTNDTKVY